jgi:hypothetical protein
LSNSEDLQLIVGDNPFHGISHLSQAKSRSREAGITDPKGAAAVVEAAVRSGATGFMFSVSGTTLSVLGELSHGHWDENLDLYPIVPYAYEQVRESVAKGTQGLATSMFRRMALSGNLASAASAFYGAAKGDLGAILGAYVRYEYGRLESVKPSKAKVRSLFLHEVITDMAVALGMNMIFERHYRTSRRLGVTPGFETRNFLRLVETLRALEIPLDRVTIAAPFNESGFQMTPDKESCERVLETMTSRNVLAFSILAGGYHSPSAARSYLRSIPNIKGAVVGASSEKQAVESFKVLKGS